MRLGELLRKPLTEDEDLFDLMGTYGKTRNPGFFNATILLLFVLNIANAYDPLDPSANITITWDVVKWTDDGYVASVTIQNYQQYRHVQSPGWTLGWTWAKDEVIWSMAGAQATEQGNCSPFQNDRIPHSCSRNPNIVDLLPGDNYTNQFRNCCKGGVLAAWAQEPTNSVSAFQITVGRSGNTNKTVRLPKNFSFRAPGPGYTCNSPQVVKSTKFPAGRDGRRSTQALAFHDDLLMHFESYIFLMGNDQITCDGSEALMGFRTAISSPKNLMNTQLLHCTTHMCPVRIHWHIKTSYKEYWRAKITITNFNYMTNYSQWNIVAQHPAFSNLVAVYSFNNKPLPSYANNINDTSMFWGTQHFNDILIQAQPQGFGAVQSEFLFAKNKKTFSFRNGYAFPHKLYFNGDNCIMPSPDTYPRLPNGNSALKPNKYMLLISTLGAVALAATVVIC
eukprot:Gb_25603 [translate_table: standard]